MLFRSSVPGKNGKEVFSTSITNEKGFDFKLLAADQTKMELIEVEDTQLKTGLSGFLHSDQKIAIENAKVNLLDGNNAVVKSVLTDVNGKFQFKNISPDINYIVSLDQNDTHLSNAKQVLLMDEKGNVLKESTTEKGKFNLTLLPEDKQKLSYMYVEDESTLSMRPEKVKSNFPAKFVFADVDNDQSITITELNAAVTQFNTGKSGVSKELITEFIDWFLN